MTRTEIWLTEMMCHFKSIDDMRRYYEHLVSLPNCNTCKRKDCKHKPKYGEDVRFNCFAYTDADRKTENCSEKPNNCEPNICDFCRYYNSNIPCGLTPSACKEADKFAEEFVKGLKKNLKPQLDKDINVRSKTEPMKTTDYCDICKRDMCEGCIADATNPYCVPSHYEINYEPKDEQTEPTMNPDLIKFEEEWECIGVVGTDPNRNRNNCTLELFDDDGNCIEPQTDCAWK